MNRFFSSFLMAFMAFCLLQAGEVTFDFSTAEGIAAMGYSVPEPSAGTNLTLAGPVTVDGVTLSATNGATETRIWNSQGSYTLRIYVDGSVTLSVAEGSITGITVNAANATNFDLIADVGNFSIDGTVGTWTGSEAAVTLTHVGSKNAQVANIVVTTSSEGPGGSEEDPIDPNILKLDSLQNLSTLEDGTAFQFTSEVYVNYQWNDHLWVMQLDEEGYSYTGVIYGDTGKEYRLGSVIPAGWTGKKATYKGLVEIGEPAHFKNAKNILDEEYYSPFDCTGGLSFVADPENGWENYKVYFEGVHLSEINNNLFEISETETRDGITFEATMTGFNKFGIEYPEIDSTELYNIEGMMTIFNGVMELYPITITSNPGTRLWKVLYEGTNGQYKISDTLFVAATVDTGNRKLVFVTDNVDKIYYDTYAEWGYAEWMDWYPDWIALDCSDNEEMYNALTSMEVLAPCTVKGDLLDDLTNPRLVLNSTPTALEDVELPTLTLFKYDLDEDYLGASGHEIGQAVGYLRYIDGMPYLCSGNDSVMVKLNFDFAPQLSSQMTDGFHYSLLCVFTIDEPWVDDIDGAPRRISAYDDNYFTNYTIYPLDILWANAVDEIMPDKQVVDVKYVSPAGIVSKQPLDGMNIVVTTHSDGSRTAVKRMK